MKEFTILNKNIGGNSPVFIVAEIGANHNGNVELAKKMVKVAADCGVDAVKFQTYTSEELLADKDRIITWGNEEYRKSEPIGEMFDRLALPRKVHKEVFDYARRLGVIPFSTPFSVEGLHFLESLGVPCVKVAASDVNFLDMLKEISKINKPVMLSLGKCTLSEADRAISTLLNGGCDKIVIMHCVSQYPSPMNEMNLKVIESLKVLYPECIIGFSDHSVGITATLGAVALGAKVIEKHFTLDRKMLGPDHWFSMDPTDMKDLVTEIRNLEVAMGHPRKRVLECELDEKLKSTRSLVLRKSIKEGERITEDHLKMLRPGWGIQPYDKEKIIGMRVNRNLETNTVLKWEYLK
ncbi:N,N'-diacetyllegionaminic acid synthase [Clostridium tepidiprofundi DSM 19306]|uniref:N,N'-diacetyllegionaminic acid synthase n=1 Tax=Clostridium tepidiprofundi DSM 19306 TaxID=1121338 RepID=A0A151B4U4_9CLOT|nr:N-acetylneuraminate synthase family protein [Clostridium tepidiprofundi]KYH34823.1 N,N'-diacetyllegionaminic acid synthase [Clostridium tepidiprofundi DSM 19306]